MNNTSITYLVAALAGVFSFAVFIAWVVAPAWQSYSRWWERIAASLLSLYVLAAFLGLGALTGAGVVYMYDRL